MKRRVLPAGAVVLVLSAGGSSERSAARPDSAFGGGLAGRRVVARGESQPPRPPGRKHEGLRRNGDCVAVSPVPDDRLSPAQVEERCAAAAVQDVLVGGQDGD